MGGGFGGSMHADGCDAVDNALSNCSNTPVEALDIGYDFFRVHSYELAPDSFGHGAHRGGAGFYRRYEVLKDGVTFSVYSDHFKAGPDGLFGGTAGMQGHCHCIRDGKVVPFEVDGIRSGKETRGHRFMAPKPFVVKGFADYVKKLRAAKVILDGGERAKLILDGARILAKKEKLALVEATNAGWVDLAVGLGREGRTSRARSACHPERSEGPP